MLLISFFIMYGVMFLNVSQTSHIYFSLNRLYMTILMVSPMSLLMLKLMPPMYPNKSVNQLIIVVSSMVFISSFTSLRRQSGIGDHSYLKGMKAILRRMNKSWICATNKWPIALKYGKLIFLPPLTKWDMKVEIGLIGFGKTGEAVA